MNKVIGLVLVLVIGATLVGGLLAPTVGAIQTNVGDEITKINESPIVLREAKENDILTITRTVVDGATTDTLRLNGEIATGPTGAADTWNVGVLSDGFYIQINAAANSAVGTYYRMDATTPAINYLSGGGTNGASYGIEFKEGVITIYGSYGTENQTTITTAPYTWAYVVCPYGEGKYCAPIAGGVGYVSDAKDVILCGAYASGELDTMYYYKGGTTYLSNTAYIMTVDIQTALTGGTTDIYTATTSVAVSDGTNTETFTPYRVLLPYEVTGHATSGAYYAMFGVIGLLGIVLLVTIAASAIRSKY